MGLDRIPTEQLFLSLIKTDTHAGSHETESKENTMSQTHSQFKAPSELYTV